MRTSAFSVALAWALLGAAAAQEPRIPEGSPPSELIGRWLEKTATRSGDLVGYNVYSFSRASEFTVATRVRNEKTQAWVEAKKLFPQESPPLAGYFEVTPSGAINFYVLVPGMAILSAEAQFTIK